MNPFKDWLEDVRSSDEATKKFWLFMLTSVSMVFVVALWAGYVTISTPAVPLNDKAVAKAEESAGALAIFGKGLDITRSALGSSLSRGIALVKDTVFKKENTITISNKNRNFVLETLAATPKRSLPN